MKTTPDQRKRTAFHEAGHAVIGRVLTLPCGRATIRANHSELEAGHAITPAPYKCLAEWEMRGKTREASAVWHARIITYMAGAEAELELLGLQAIGDGDDRKQIEWMACSEGYRTEDDPDAPQWRRLEPRLRGMTRMLVRRHRDLINRVAHGLLERTTLTGRQIDRLIGRSINDVKVNAPFLLAVHRQRRSKPSA